jgi:hypothetical protein
VTTVSGLAHDRDDLVDRGRIRRVPAALVRWDPPGMMAGHRRRGPGTAGGEPTTDEQTWLPPLETGQVAACSNRARPNAGQEFTGRWRARQLPPSRPVAEATQSALLIGANEQRRERRACHPLARESDSARCLLGGLDSASASTERQLLQRRCGCVRRRAWMTLSRAEPSCCYACRCGCSVVVGRSARARPRGEQDAGPRDGGGPPILPPMRGQPPTVPRSGSPCAHFFVAFKNAGELGFMLRLGL